MTVIDCRYGKGANFELTKACLAGGKALELSPALNFTRHFARVQTGEKIRSKQGQRLPSASSPQYFRRHDAAWQQLQKKERQGPAGAQAPSSSAHRTAGNASRPAAGHREKQAPQVPEWSVALMSGALAIGVAIVAGMVLSGGIKNTGLPHLGGSASGRLADGPIPHSSPVIPASLPAVLPAAVDSEPLSVPEQLEPPAAALDTPPEAPAPAKKKKPRKARIDKANKPSRSNPFTGDQPAYSASLPAGTLYKVMQCVRIASLIRHELCMWRACKNKWGRDGCPAYADSTASRQIAGIRR